VILLHSQERGKALVEELGRAAQLKVAQGVPANVIPLSLWHTASLGLDVWLSAIAWGASQVVVLVTAEEAPQYLDGLQSQMDVAQAILNGLGYTGTHLQLLRAAAPPTWTPACRRCSRPRSDAKIARALCHHGRKARHARPGAGPPDRPVAAGRQRAARGHRAAGARRFGAARSPSTRTAAPCA
jgi:hypothetical protein